MDTPLPLAQPTRPPARLARLPAFWLALLALVLLGLLEHTFITWCWPRYGESACTRFSLPLNFLLDLAFFVLVVLVFERRWRDVLLVGLLGVTAYQAGAMVRALGGGLAGEGQPFFVSAAALVAAWLVRTLFLALLRVVIPAAILRWLARRAGGLTNRSSVLFGATMAAFAAVYHIALFGGASIVSPGSVAPGYIFTPLDLLGALLTGLAGWLAVVIGRRIMPNSVSTLER
jgi:hypothetical protein